jgi:hypothetical protein
MDIDYLREQATQYRDMASTSRDPEVRDELLELAAICEELANAREDRTCGG